MFHFLGFILLLVLAVLLVGFVIVVTFVRRLFGMGKKQTTTYYYTTRNPRNDSANTRRGNASGDDTVAVEEGELHINRKKIFGKDEGEYVSYEEVKE